jgi:hypothetical protein
MKPTEYRHKRCLNKTSLSPTLAETITNGGTIDRLWCQRCKKNFLVREFTIDGRGICVKPIPVEAIEEYTNCVFGEVA